MTVDVSVALIACAVLLALGFCIGAWLSARLDRERVKKAHAHYDRHLDDLRLELGRIGERIGAIAPAPAGAPAAAVDMAQASSGGEVQTAPQKSVPKHLRSLAVDVPRAMEIPAQLVGPETKAVLEHFAPLLGFTPTELLRAAVNAGLSGSAPVLEPILRGLEPLLRDTFSVDALASEDENGPN